MVTIMKGDIVLKKNSHDTEYMEALVDPSVYGNDETVQACKRAFDNMQEGEQLVMTMKYPDFLPPVFGEVIQWRVEKVQD